MSATPVLSPAEVRAYLQRHGWRPEAAGRVAELWTRSDTELLVPLIPTAPDYDVRVNVLTADLARFEERQAALISQDISRQFVDVTDFRALHGHDEDLVPLEVGQRVFSSARRAVIAGAAATMRRRGYYGKQIPRKAREQARSVRVGHTRKGSYIVPVVSQARLLTLPWQGEQPQLLTEVEDAAFDRRVTTTMARALGVLQQLVVDRERTPTNSEIHDGVGEGVSYELCDALVGSLKDPAIEQMEINFHWAQAVHRPSGVGQSVGFPTESQPILQAVAAKLRDDTANRQQVVYGVVVSLSSLAEESGGRVNVHALIDGVRKTIRLELGPDHYAVAVACHKRTPVLVRGILHQEQGRMPTMEVEAFEPDASLPLE